MWPHQTPFHGGHCSDVTEFTPSWSTCNDCEFAIVGTSQRSVGFTLKDYIKGETLLEIYSKKV